MPNSKIGGQINIPSENGGQSDAVDGLLSREGSKETKSIPSNASSETKKRFIGSFEGPQ